MFDLLNVAKHSLKFVTVIRKYSLNKFYIYSSTCTYLTSKVVHILILYNVKCFIFIIFVINKSFIFIRKIVYRKKSKSIYMQFKTLSFYIKNEKLLN